MVFRREHRILGSQVSFSALLEQAPVKCRERRVLRCRRPSALPAVHGSVRDSWSFAERGSLSTASAITCVASFIVAEGTSSSSSHLGGRPSTPRWRLSSLALRPVRAVQAPSGGCGETSVASISILWGRPHAFAMPMNRSESFSDCLQEMSRGERAPAASKPVRTLQMTARKRVICSPRWLPTAVRTGRSFSVGIHMTKPSRASLGAPLSWPMLRNRSRRPTRASTDGLLPSIRGFRWASTLELVSLVPGHRRHGGRIETVTMWPRLAAGLPSLPPDAFRRVRFDHPRGHS